MIKIIFCSRGNIFLIEMNRIPLQSSFLTAKKCLLKMINVDILYSVFTLES